jgi:diguanylate cyclase (GGDEF)-like protein
MEMPGRTKRSAIYRAPEVERTEATTDGESMNNQPSGLAEDVDCDGLNRFVNRDALALLVEYAIAHARRDGECLTLLWFDLVGLDEIDKALGDEVRDDALVEFGETLRSELRGSDVVAYIGGDEFAVLLAGTDETQASVVINHLTAVIRERNKSTDRAFPLEAVVTRAMFEPSSESASLDDLMAQALVRRHSGRSFAVR